jgi:flagellar basal-body rod protein FlgF
VVRGLYASAGGLLVESARSDVIAGNLASVSVPGHRRDVPTVSTFERTLERTAAAGAAGPASGALGVVLGTRVDLRPGGIRHTGAKLDLALDGPGYFCVQTPSGEAYTRGGAFGLDASQRLLAASGHPILGRSGPIRLTGAEVEVRENGDLLVDGALVDRLKLVEFRPGAVVRKLGGGLLRPESRAHVAPAPESIGRVRQGYLEDSNVNPVAELAAMLSALRAFEASQRALRASDQTLDRAINEIGRV